MTTRTAMLAVLSLAALAALIQPARGQSAPSDLDAKLAVIGKSIDARRRELKVPGAALVIVKDDRVVLLRGLGKRDRERNLPVTPETRFAIGSTTKAFTSMLLMMAADDGKLALTDPPGKYLPYFKMRDPETDAKITLSDLLCHRSGLNRTDMAWMTGKLSPDEIVRVACNAKPTAKLGEKWQYQNNMFVAAGLAVAKAENTTWQRMLRERILLPLGMRHTDTSVREMRAVSDHAVGYTVDPIAGTVIYLPMRNIDAVAPAGAINSCARDMAQWLRFMLAEGAIDGRRLVSEKSFREVLTGHMTMGGGMEYGYGWMLHDWNKHRVAEHSGGIDGYNALVALMPDQHLGFAILTNVSASSLPSYASEQIWNGLVGPAPKAAETASVPQPALGATVSEGAVAGSYRIEGVPITLTVAKDESGLKISVPGQPTYTLKRVVGGRYKLGEPAPEGFYATFRPAKDNPKITELYLEQPQGNVTFRRLGSEGFVAPITMDELMRRQIEALGGEKALRRHQTLVMRADVEIPNEGIGGQAIFWRRAPGQYALKVTLMAVGKKIGVARGYFDGTRGADELSFAGSSEKHAEALVDARINGDFYAPLNWKQRYKSARIKTMGKVGDEEAYVLELVPEGGNTIVQYVSTKSFLVLRSEEANGSSLTYGDYRSVDGVMLPFSLSMSASSLGDVVATIREARFDVQVPTSAFTPAHPPVTHDAAEWAAWRWR